MNVDDTPNGEDKVFTNVHGGLHDDDDFIKMKNINTQCMEHDLEILTEDRMADPANGFPRPVGMCCECQLYQLCPGLAQWLVGRVGGRDNGSRDAAGKVAERVIRVPRVPAQIWVPGGAVVGVLQFVIRRLFSVRGQVGLRLRMA